MRSTWTDSRLDDLKDEVSGLSLRLTEMDGRLTGRIDSLIKTILVIGGALVAAFVGLLAAMLGLIATQL